MSDANVETAVEKRSFFQRVKDTAFICASAAGTFIGKVVAPIQQAAVNVMFGLGRVVLWLQKIPVIGRVLTFIPVASVAMAFITAVTVVMYMFELGVTVTLAAVILSAGSLAWAFLVGTMELACIFALLDLTVRAIMWILIPAYREQSCLAFEA